MSRERYRQSVLVSTDVRPGGVGYPCVTPYGVFFLRVAFPHRFRGGLRCFVPPGLSEKSGIASLPKLLQAASGQVR
jgi:hypothetical protein